MFRPFLLVGIGGSGGKTLRTLREDLTRRLEEVGWKGPFPQAWQMVHIDVPTSQDGDDPDLPDQLPIEHYQGLVARGIVYRHLDETLVKRAHESARDGLAGWRPDPREVTVPVDKGAGQYRALGRLITLASLQQVKEGLQRAIVNLQGADVPGELGLLSRAFGGNVSVSEANPTAIVISSMAGGSGAGALVDICDALRALAPSWGDHSIGVLFAPDVFDDIPPEMRKGIRPNALATLSEILSGFWNTSGPTQEDNALLALGGIAAPRASRLGPRYPMIVGKKNSKVDFGTQNDVYRAMGRALGAWLSSDLLQDTMSTYVMTNWSANAPLVDDATPLKVFGQETPFGAVGFARVSLGRDRLRQYAREALARKAVERVLRRHLEGRSRGDDRSDDELLIEHVEYSFGPFLARSGLDERSRDHNDVLVALTPQDRKARFQKVATRINEQVGQAAGSHSRDRRWWRDRIVFSVREVEHTAVKEDLDAVEANARTWVTETQDRLTTLVSTAVASEGAAAAARMVGKLRHEVDAALHELPGEIEQYQRMVESTQQDVDAVLARGNATQLPATHQNLQPAVGQAIKIFFCEGEIVTRRVAMDLLKDLKENFLAPLEQAVSDGYEKLLREESTKTDGKPSVVKTWPTGDVVPTRLAPSRNEHLLGDVEQFPSEVETLVKRTTGLDDVGGSMKLAVEEIISGSFGPDDHALARLTTRWVPRRVELRPQVQMSPTKAAFDLRLGAPDLLTRAEAWVTRKDQPVGKHLGETLREYLDETTVEPAVFGDRLVRFEGRFLAALDSARPLVKINPGVLSAVHQRKQETFSVTLSGLPFAEGTRAYETAMKVLVSRGVRDEKARQAFTEAPAEFVDVFTVLGEPYQPVVFDSLMVPLVEDWKARCGDPDGRSGFWRWRRARPLPQFIPADPRVRVAMVRGWFTASLLGQLRVQDEGRTSILLPRTTSSEWLPFPFPTLSRARSRTPYERLPIMLESLPLAMLDVNREAELTALEPYGRLRDLGTSAEGGLERYEDANQELDRWLRHGELLTGSEGVPDAPAGGSGSLETRREAVLSRMRNLESNYEGLFEEVEQGRESDRPPLVWEVRDDVRIALGDLTRAVEAIKEDAGRGEW